MVYLGQGSYFDTDDLSDAEYSEWCKHKENVEKYFKYRRDKNAELKAQMIGLDIKKLLGAAADFAEEHFHIASRAAFLRAVGTQAEESMPNKYSRFLDISVGGN